MNTYIQDKLDEIENDLKEKGYTKHERETVIGILEQSLTDYHNHIVERLKDRQKIFDFLPQDQWGYKMIKASDLDILSLLQDTNLKE